MGIRVLVADNQVMIRQAVEGLLRQADDLSIVDLAHSGREAVEKACRLQPDVVVIEVGLPTMDGLDAIRVISQRCPHVNILVLTKEDDPDLAMRAIEAGAVGYVLKDIEPPHLLNAIRNVASGKTTLNPTVARHVIARLAGGDGAERQQDDTRLKGLSEREIEVLIALTGGLSDREIARSLFLSEATVKTHLKAIYRKLAVRNRAQAAALAALKGLLASARR